MCFAFVLTLSNNIQMNGPISLSEWNATMKKNLEDRMNRRNICVSGLHTEAKRWPELVWDVAFSFFYFFWSVPSLGFCFISFKSGFRANVSSRLLLIVLGILRVFSLFACRTLLLFVGNKYLKLFLLIRHYSPVRGMMYYRKALELQAFLDMAKDDGIWSPDRNS